MTALEDRPLAAAAPGRGSLLRAVVAQSAMELRLMIRSAESLVVTLGIPVGILVFFSQVDVLPTGDRDPVDFLVPGVLAISVMSSALVSLAIQTAFERKYAVLKRLGGTPLTRPAFLASKALAVLTVLAIQTAVILVIAVGGLDWQLSGGIVLVLLGLVLGTFTFAALALLMAGTLRAEATLAIANALFLVLLLVSGVMFEADALPGPVAAVGAWLPSGALGDVLRGAFAEPVEVAGRGLAVLAGWGVVAGGLTARWFRWEP